MDAYATFITDGNFRKDRRYEIATRICLTFMIKARDRQKEKKKEREKNKKWQLQRTVHTTALSFIFLFLWQANMYGFEILAFARIELNI